MRNINELEKVSEETIRFMRGKYVADEVGNGKDELKFRRGGKTILSVYIRDDRYDFLVIFGKAEREKFDAQRDEFPQIIRDIYDNSKTYHDGKWMLIPVADLTTLEAVLRLVVIKKKPNRKPFPTEQAIYGNCGHRCDLCLYYAGGIISEEFRMELLERINRVYEVEKTLEEARAALVLCNGCSKYTDEPCSQKKCAAKKGVKRCTDCPDYDCGKATAGIRGKIEPKSLSAEDITWAILPYVPRQYGN